jgi:flagellar basal-body rod protein FlgB
MEQILHFTRARHDAIASNIANVETPYYKAVDAPVEEFKKALATSLRRQQERHVKTFEMDRTPRLTPKPGGGLAVELIDADSGGFLKHDENNVDIDREMVKLVQNTSLHNTIATLIKQQFDLLDSAIKGRRG